MRAILLYATIVLVWGSTWFAITFQLGPVAEELSVAYRFGLASIALFAYTGLSGKPFRIPFADYRNVVMMGVLMYSLSYLLVYHATSCLASGLVAVVFSLIVVVNGCFERLFFRRQFEARMMLAAVFGVCGIACLFWPEVSSFEVEDRTITGAALAVASVFIASLGNMTAIAVTAKNLPLATLNAHAMAWGATSSVIVALLMGHSINFSLEPAYVLSLSYLALFGSAIAFGAYLALLKSIGSARAAYTSVLFPLVALVISTIFEGYRWSLAAVVGVVVIAAGNWLALTRINEGLNHD